MNAFIFHYFWLILPLLFLALIWEVWFRIKELLVQGSDVSDDKQCLNNAEVKTVFTIISVIVLVAGVMMWLLQLSSSAPRQPVLCYWSDSPYIQLAGIAVYVIVCGLLLVWVCFLRGKFSGARLCAQLLPLYHQKSIFSIPDAPLFRSERFYKMIVGVVVILALVKLAFALWLFAELGIKPT